MNMNKTEEEQIVEYLVCRTLFLYIFICGIVLIPTSSYFIIFMNHVYRMQRSINTRLPITI
jgi:hypothetical protein